MPKMLYVVEKMVTGRLTRPSLEGPQRIGESCLVTRFSKITLAATRKEEWKAAVTREVRALNATVSDVDKS